MLLCGTFRAACTCPTRTCTTAFPVAVNVLVWRENDELFAFSTFPTLVALFQVWRSDPLWLNFGRNM